MTKDKKYKKIISHKLLQYLRPILDQLHHMEAKKMKVKYSTRNKKHKNKSFTKKIITVMIIILMICQLGVASIISYNAKKTTKKEINNQIITTLKSIALTIDGDALESFIKDKQKDDQSIQSYTYVENLQDYLKKVQEVCDFEYVYIVDKFEDDKMHYIMDADSVEEDGEAFGNIVELDEGASGYISEEYAFKNGSFVTEPIHYNEWGALTSAYLSIYNSNNEPIALLAVDILGNNYDKALDKLGIDALIITVFCSIIISLLLGAYIKKSLKPLVSIQDAAVSVSEGDTDIAIETTSQDEIGKTVQAINKMASNLKSMIANVTNNSDDLFNYSNHLTDYSTQFTISSEQVASDVTEIAESTEDQLNKLELILKKVDTINEEISDVVTKSEKATDDIKTSYEYAEKGELMLKDSSSKIMTANDSMESSKEKMVELKNKITKISDFVQDINNISKQTNLLALNAAIESARAGAAGNGFAVVANEVKNLAGHSTAAANEIVTILRDINLSSTDVVSAIDETFMALKESVKASKDAEIYFYNILDANSSVKNTVSEVIKGIGVCSKETEEILVAVKEVNESSIKLVAGCQNISAVTQEQYATSEEIMRSALALNTMAKKLQNSIEQFTKS